MTEREALKLAFEALKQIDEAMPFPVAKLAIMEAEKALAQPEQEPVVWMYQDKSTHEVRFQKHMRNFVDHGATYETPLYTNPLQRIWVGLTPQERDEINEQVYGAVPHHVAFHAAIEAKLKEKNT